MREAANLHANLCQVIADPTRISILYLLHDNPRRVNELVEALDLPQGTISRHLKVLREQSVVDTQRTGSSITYSLRFTRIIQALEIMRTIKKDILTEDHELIQRS